MTRNPLAERIDHVRACPRSYRGAEVVSLGFWMKEQTHEDLVAWFQDLNLKEWRIAWGAGIPGSSYFDAMTLYRALSAKVERVRSSDGGAA